MAHFSYKVKDSEGNSQKGLVEAASLKHASKLLHERGFFIIEVKEQLPGLLTKFKSTHISSNDLVHFTSQLSTMVTAGLTLVESLAILRQQLKSHAFTQLVSQLEEEVRSGKPFAAVLEKFPKVFPPIYIALVRAGEASGKLDVILARLAENLEKSRAFRNKIRGALVYPSVVVTGMIVVSVIVMTVVVPRLTPLYREFNVTLPLPTQILISISNYLINAWWFIVILGVSLYVLFYKFSQTILGRHFTAKVSLSLPIVGPLIGQATLVEVTRALSILIDGGVPILNAISISQETTGNILYKNAFREASKKVEKGFPLSEPLLENKLFPPIFGQMTMVGEQTGKLGESLFKLSHYYEMEADNAVRTLTSLIEPLIMIVLGVGVAFLVSAVLLPIYSITDVF